MKSYIVSALGLALLSPLAHAETCVDFKTCSKLMFDLKGERYIWDAKMDEYKFTGTPDVEMTKDNADLVFTALLDHAGLARLPIGDGKTYRVERGANIKEITTPYVDASAEQPPVFPSNTWDWASMRYKLKAPDEAMVIESMYRLHLPREARMQADENAGILILTGSIPMLKHMYETIRAADHPLTANAKRHYDEFHKAMLAPKPPAPPAAPDAAKK